MKTLEDTIAFHGHICPGLVIGYRVSLYALKKPVKRAEDEELVAIVENNSCAVDAVQVMTGCTFGKGNLFFRDYGKQVYTFLRRPSGKGIRIAVSWNPPEETAEERIMWERYMNGDRTKKVLETIHRRKTRKIDSLMHARDTELFRITKSSSGLPEEARIYTSIPCETCGEKVMEPRARVKDGKIVCIPCFENI
jgi:formylmethanofuran dehydrogenase subunit E